MTASTIDAGHREAHAKHGTWIEIHVPKEMSFDACEQLHDLLTEKAVDFASNHRVDVIVMGHRSSGCGVPGHPQPEEEDVD